MPWKECRGQLVVATVILLTTFISYTSQIFVIWPFLGGASLHTLFILIPLNVFVIMIYLNYALVCLTDPGTVPVNWIPDSQTHMEVKRSTHEPRYCRTCDGYKPPRTHHCRSCGRCILKMDHHCPWINNCVGFANYGHFIRFIVYVIVSAIYLFILLSCRLAQVIREMDSHGTHPSPTEATFLSINLLLSAAAIVTVGILSGYHTYCLTTNTTTIEGWEKGTALTIKSLGRIRRVKYPYNLGLYNNLCAVLGPQPLLWFWPQRMVGDGLYFPVTTKYLEDAGDPEKDGMTDAVHDEHAIHGDGIQDIDQHEHRAEDDYCAEEEGSDYRLSRYSSQTLRGTPSDCKRVSIAAPPRVRTRNSRGSNLRADGVMPATPASVRTFASASTLVDTKLPKDALP
ncbi:DHHC palmitoyltransferase-domain-containing protein [Syncephalastrum racemosum]|uniref:Palmitoyltransferase n=1 Tax=Syncephalastrum racemosum TaxID=13706 RepID=A0A1X2HFS9_SYNRA|nr:DHHC palmitoyltransferase-domain-containing protein [Syncephalastrum racemosum]